MSSWSTHTRRGFLGRALLTGGLFAFSGRTLSAFAQSDPSSALGAALLLGRRLRRAELTQTQWQDQIVPILQSVRPEELAAAVELETLRRRTPRASRGAATRSVPRLEDFEHDEGAAMRVFFFGAGRTDPPHCHFNSVTAHIVLAGEFRVRHYERLREEPGRFILRASRDRRIRAGDVTSISELRENAHWHEAITDGVLLDVEQGRLDPTRPIRNRQMLDPTTAPLADGTIVAPALSQSEGLRRFG